MDMPGAMGREGAFPMGRTWLVAGSVAAVVALMVAGTVYLVWLKLKADPTLGAARVWGGEMAFVLLLGAVAATGLLLYAATCTGLQAALLAIHMATVMTLFLLMPFSKMVHGFFRLAALVVEAKKSQKAPQGEMA